jgi:hypothetical protein
MGRQGMNTEVWWENFLKMATLNGKIKQQASVFVVLYVWYQLQEFTILLFTIDFIVA